MKRMKWDGGLLMASAVFMWMAACQDETLSKHADTPDEDPFTDGNDQQLVSLPESATCEEILTADLSGCSTDDFVGEWRSVDLCVTTDEDELYGDIPACADAQFDYDLSYDITLSIIDDHRWSSVNNGIIGSETFSLSDACLEDAMADMAPSDTCDLFQMVYENCTYEDDWCTCSYDIKTLIEENLDDYPITATGTSTLDGNVLTTVDDDTGESSDGTLCVVGDTAYLYSAEADLSTALVVVMTRQ